MIIRYIKYSNQNASRNVIIIYLNISEQVIKLVNLKNKKFYANVNFYEYVKFTDWYASFSHRKRIHICAKRVKHSVDTSTRTKETVISCIKYVY